MYLELHKTTGTLFGEKIWLYSVDHVPSANMEEVGFMINTAAKLYIESTSETTEESKNSCEIRKNVLM